MSLAERCGVNISLEFPTVIFLHPFGQTHSLINPKTGLACFLFTQGGRYHHVVAICRVSCGKLDTLPF